MSFIYPVDKEFSNHTNNYLINRGKKLGIHYGLDFNSTDQHIKNKIEGKNIYAVDDGKVIFSNFNPSGYGNTIIIKHSNGLSTLYAHILDKSPYQYGDYVKQGTIIGKVGNTGISTGPHLHFEVIDQKGTKKIESVNRTPTGEYRHNIGILKKDYKLDPKLYLPIDKNNYKSFAKKE